MLREFTIKPVLNGYIVRIGCQIVVFTSLDKLLSTIKSYLCDPSNVEESYLKNSTNSALMIPRHAEVSQAQTPEYDARSESSF